MAPNVKEEPVEESSVKEMPAESEAPVEHEKSAFREQQKLAESQVAPATTEREYLFFSLLTNWV